MTEMEWLTGDDPGPLERWVGQRASARKLRLFEVACCRRLLPTLNDDGMARAVEVAEWYAEGTAHGADLAAVRSTSAGCSAWVAVKHLAREAARDPGGAERAARCHLLREVFGNPLRPAAVKPSWLWWGNGAVLALAQTVYHDRLFEDMPLLADSLEEAGCTDPAILGHARTGGPHVRGCWLLDALTRKE